MEPILEVRNLQKCYSDKPISKIALQNISFSVMPGECVGIVGQSGSGKSTLAKIVAGLLMSTNGSVTFYGQEILHEDEKTLYRAYQHMQMIFQQPQDSFNPRKTIGWSIEEGLKNRGFDKISMEKELVRLLDEVGLSESFKQKYPYEISGGECQRAAIARALALKPKFLICDEITSALDAEMQMKIIALLKTICSRLNIACLFISHDLSLVRLISQRIVVLHEGSVVESGLTKTVLQFPSSEWTRKLLDAESFFKEAVLI